MLTLISRSSSHASAASVLELLKLDAISLQFQTVIIHPQLAVIRESTIHRALSPISRSLLFHTSTPLKMPNYSPTNGSWRHRLGEPDYPAEPNRYHLYVGLFCPFAHRVIITRQLKGLENLISMDIVKAYPKEGGGWRFPSTPDEYPGATIDHLFHSKFLSEVYFKSDPNYKGKYSVPVLFDKKRNQIVNNESEDIMRMLNTTFNDYLPEGSEQQRLNFYPPELQDKIDEVNSWMMPNLNEGVYKAGFAATQEDYDKHCPVVFQTLDRLENILDDQKTVFILGNTLSEVDIKLYTTLVRFDTIYQQHFKLMLGSIRHNYPRLNSWLKNMYWNVPGVKNTTNFKHIKENYSKSHPDINPKAITPMGPVPEVEPWTEQDQIWKLEQPNRPSYEEIR